MDFKKFSVYRGVASGLVYMYFQQLINEAINS